MVIQKMSDNSYRVKDAMKKIGNSMFYYSIPGKPKKKATYEVFSDGANFSFTIKVDGKTVHKSPSFKTEALMNKALTQQQIKMMRAEKNKTTDIKISDSVNWNAILNSAKKAIKDPSELQMFKNSLKNAMNKYNKEDRSVFKDMKALLFLLNNGKGSPEYGKAANEVKKASQFMTKYM